MEVGTEAGKWSPRNWKKLNEQAVKQLPPVQRSKYLAYEAPPRQVADVLNEIKKRLMELKKYEDSLIPKITREERDDKQKYINIMGRLKAAEARDRLRLLRLHYEARHTLTIERLVTFKPTALQGLRLECLLKTRPLDQIKLADRSCGVGDLKPDKETRKRIEDLMRECNVNSLMRT